MNYRPHRVVGAVLLGLLYTGTAHADPRDDAKRAFDEGLRLANDEANYLAAAAQF